MSESDIAVKGNAKDSVFTDLFSIPKYLFELYQTLHPEDKSSTVNNISSVTTRCVLTEHQYNDLGFLVRDKLLVLVEAQSTWSPNIVIRLLSYAVQSINDYFTTKGILLYSNSKAKFPKPELYVIFTGERKSQPTMLSLKELFFPNEESCDIEAKVHMIYYQEDARDIINQYITFCKVLDSQIKKYGKNKRAIEETIRICRDKDVLAEYLKVRETEIMDIMTTLFDQDYVTKVYGDDRERKGERKGKREGKQEVVIAGFKVGVSKELLQQMTGFSEKEIDKIISDAQ